MEKRVVVSWENTAAGMFVSCPVCRAKKLLRLYPGTRAEDLPVYCRRCRRVIVFDVQPGQRPDRVTIQRIRPGSRRSPSRSPETLTPV